METTGLYVQESNQPDRRKNPRYRISDTVIAFLDNIPCRILDMSRSGMAINCIIYGEAPNKHPILDFLLSEEKVYIKNIPCNIVHNKEDSNNSSSHIFTIIRFGICFSDLDNEQQTQVDKIIAHHIVGKA